MMPSFVKNIENVVEPVKLQLSAYRQPPSSNSSEDVEKKLRKFCDCYHDDIMCFDGNSKTVVFPNKSVFEERYRTVFRESPNLDAIITRRFLLAFSDETTDISSEPFAFVIDCETFRNLVKPIGGSLDGSTGLSDLIQEADIVVMYKIVGREQKEHFDDKCWIQKAWFLTKDEEGLGKKKVALNKSDVSENNELNGDELTMVSSDEVESSIALTNFWGIAREEVDCPNDLAFFELSQNYLQDHYDHT